MMPPEVGTGGDRAPVLQPQATESCPALSPGAPSTAGLVVAQRLSRSPGRKGKREGPDSCSADGGKRGGGLVIESRFSSPDRC